MITRRKLGSLFTAALAAVTTGTVPAVAVPVPRDFRINEIQDIIKNELMKYRFAENTRRIHDKIIADVLAALVVRGYSHVELKASGSGPYLHLMTKVRIDHQHSTILTEFGPDGIDHAVLSSTQIG